MILFCPRCGAELASEFRGAAFETSQKCSDCGVAADPPAQLAPSEAEVTYGLDEWPTGDRVTLTGALAEDGIPYRWEAGVVLAVPEAVEEVVDGILDDLERSDADWVAGGEDDGGKDDGGEDDGGEDGAGEPADGGEEAQAAMSELFVLADRLQHSPSDLILAGELAATADVAAASLPPYGIDATAWQRINDLAAAVVDSEDEDSVAATAVVLRDHLRPFV